MSIDFQWTIDYQFYVNLLPMDNWLLMECQLITNAIPIDYQWVIDFQYNANRLPMDNSLPIECQLTSNGQLITNFMSTYLTWLTLRCYWHCIGIGIGFNEKDWHCIVIDIALTLALDLIN